MALVAHDRRAKLAARQAAGSAMADAIVVLNAGSSSLKFSLFVVRGGRAGARARGQLEGLSTAPHFVARDADGADDRRAQLGPRARPRRRAGAPGRVLRQTLDGDRCARSGTVSSTAASVPRPVRVDAACSPTSRRSSRSRRCTSRTTSRRSARCSARAGAAAGRVLRHVVPPHASPTSRSRSRCRPSSPTRRAPLRLPRPLVRVHRVRAAGVDADAARGRDRRRAPRQRRVDVRAARAARASRRRWASRRSTA